MTPEGQVKEALKKFLKEIGAYYFMPVPSGFGKHTVDFLVCYKGRFFGIETKAPGINKATRAQEVAMDDIYRAGGSCCVENTVELYNVRRMMVS